MSDSRLSTICDRSTAPRIYSIERSNSILGPPAEGKHEGAGHASGPVDLGKRLAQQPYDLLLRAGHVIDPNSGVSGIRDVAIRGGKIAAVSAQIDPASALQTVDVTGLYVTAGLIDIHVHVYAGTGEPNSYAGDNSVYPDGFTFRCGVTTVVDAGARAGAISRISRHV